MKKWLENLKISKKLAVGFSTVSCLGVILGLISVFSYIVLLNDQTSSYKNNTLGIQYVSNAEIDLINLRSTVRDLYIYYDTDKEDYISKISDLMIDFQTQIDNYGKTIYDSQDKEYYDSIVSAFNSYKDIVNSVLEAEKSGATSADILKVLNDQKSNAQDTSAKFDAARNYKATSASQTIAYDKTTTLVFIIIMVCLIVAFLGFAVYLMRLISSMISEPMQKFAEFGEMLAVGDIEIDRIIEEKDKLMKERKDEVGILADSFDKIISGTIRLSNETNAIAAGDLTTRVVVRSEKDLLGIAINKLTKNFHELTSSIIATAEQVDSSAKMVADSSTTLSQGSTEQASSVEELSTSIADVSQRIKDNADGAEKAKEVTQLTANILQESVSNMNLAREAMDEISATSKNISKVIKAIDDIAFQTNILALNAAVEAARAGTAGKGFAVVADEVRNLSQKSAEAAKSTTSLIESSIMAVKKGSDLVNRTSRGFSEVVEKAAEVTKLIDEIALQAQSQAVMVSQISIGVEQVSSVIQMNAAQSEESAAASEELSGLADSLKFNVERFKV